MKCNPLFKKWIDDASYEQMLAKWRHAPSDDPMFSGETGQYFKTVMMKKKSEISPEAAVQASKSVGWD